MSPFWDNEKIIGACSNCSAKMKWLERKIKKQIRKAIKKSPPNLQADLKGKENWCSKCILNYLEPLFKEFYSKIPKSEIDNLNPVAKKLLRRALKTTEK